MLSLKNQALIEAYDRGYRIVDGEPFSSNGKLAKCLEKFSTMSYYTFSYRESTGRKTTIKIHRLVAYQKYGNEMFKYGIEVRHFDGNSLNNLGNNILLGTHHQNMMDIPKEIRKQTALNAASFIKIHDHNAILRRRKQGATYKELMNEFGITSKGTISFIINKSHSLVSSSLVQEN